MIMLMYKHKLQTVDLCGLRWEQIDMMQCTLHPTGPKNETVGVHPLAKSELWALRMLHMKETGSHFVFLTNQGTPISAGGFRRMLGKAGQNANLPFFVLPRMLRHRGTNIIPNDNPSAQA